MNTLKDIITRSADSLKELERITERGLWWVRIDRAEDKHHQATIALLDGVVKEIEDMKHWDKGECDCDGMGCPHDKTVTDITTPFKALIKELKDSDIENSVSFKAKVAMVVKEAVEAERERIIRRLSLTIGAVEMGVITKEQGFLDMVGQLQTITNIK